MKIQNPIRQLADKIQNLLIVLGVFLWAASPVLGLTTKNQPTPLPTPTPAKVDYFLAYPGILPDHFLYPIKMVRDRIWLFLTTDPLRKAETLLLFADKRLGAGKALIDEGKEQLGISTLTKAEKYLERAIAQERIASQKDKDTTAFLEKLSVAAKKHEEVLAELQKKVSENGKGVIGEILRYPRRGYEEVRQRLGK
jgi:hypothetical protein